LQSSRIDANVAVSAYLNSLREVLAQYFELLLVRGEGAQDGLGGRL
jgi:hypothetical protein